MLHCVLMWNQVPCLDIELKAYPDRCDVVDYTIVGPIPDALIYTSRTDLFEGGKADACARLSNYLMNRIPKAVFRYPRDILMQTLGIYQNRDKFPEDITPYFFLPALLWHLDMADGIALYPKQTEYICFAGQDSRFETVYRWSAYRSAK